MSGYSTYLKSLSDRTIERPNTHRKKEENYMEAERAGKEHKEEKKDKKESSVASKNILTNNHLDFFFLIDKKK